MRHLSVIGGDLICINLQPAAELPFSLNPQHLAENKLNGDSV